MEITMSEESLKAKVVTEKVAAEMIGLSVKTLQNHRYLGLPPTYVKLGKSIRYRVADLQTYLDECTVEPRHETK